MSETVTIVGLEYPEVLTPEAIGFIVALDREFGARRVQLLERRRRRQVARLDDLDFSDRTRSIRDDLSWRVAAPAPGTTIVRTAKVEPKKNGIRDLQISLFGLRPSKLRQVMVNCQTDKGATAWQLDTTGSQSWPLVIHRAGTETSADLFLEPPPADCHQKSFTINVTYEDNQAANANFQADKHCDPKLAVDAKTPGVETLDAWVFLTGDEKLFGKQE